MFNLAGWNYGINDKMTILLASEGKTNMGVGKKGAGLLKSIATASLLRDRTEHNRLMLSAGTLLAEALHTKVPDQSQMCIVCAVEDADHLAKGLFDGLERLGREPGSLFLKCYWNDEIIEVDDQSISAVKKSYCEEFNAGSVVHVLIAPIISSRGPVRVNVTKMLSGLIDAKAFLVGLELTDGSSKVFREKLSLALQGDFQYVYLGTRPDDGLQITKMSDAEGDYYVSKMRPEKRQKTPELVKSRRRIRHWNTPSLEANL